MVQPPGLAVHIEKEAEIVGLLVVGHDPEEPRRVRRRPGGRNHPEVEHGSVPLHGRPDVGGGHRHVVENPDADPVRPRALRPVDVPRLLTGRRDGPIDVPGQLGRVTPGADEAVGSAVAVRRLDPLATDARSLDGGDGDIELLVVPRPPRPVTETGLRGFGQHEAVGVVVAPAPQVHRGPLLLDNEEAKHVAGERHGRVEVRCQQLHVRKHR